MGGERDTDRLSAEEHETYRQDIREDYLEGTERARKPKVIILAGQPGAGKSTLRDAALREFDPKEGAVVVDVDDLRGYHPAYGDFAVENDRTAASRVQSDAGQWGDELIADATDARRNIVIDGTLKTPKNARAVCQRFSRANPPYEVEVWALAVAKEDSENHLYQRFEHGREKNGYGRWVPEGPRDEAYAGMRNSVGKLELHGDADVIRVFRNVDRNTVDCTYANRGARKGGTNGAVAALDAERARAPTPVELFERNRALAELVDRQRERSPALNGPEDARLVSMHLEAQQDLGAHIGRRLDENSRHIPSSDTGRGEKEDIGMSYREARRQKTGVGKNTRQFNRRSRLR